MKKETVTVQGLVITIIRNQAGHGFPVIPEPYTCHTCRNADKCDEDAFLDCNYQQPCHFGCAIKQWCYKDWKIAGKQFWKELSKRIAGCQKSERIEYEEGFLDWQPADRRYCIACSLWHGTGHYCTRHAEPCVRRTDY